MQSRSAEDSMSASGGRMQAYCRLMMNEKEAREKAKSILQKKVQRARRHASLLPQRMITYSIFTMMVDVMVRWLSAEG